MRRLKTFLVGIVAISIAAVVFAIPKTADAQKVKIRVQSVIPSKADEVVMLKDFAANVKALTNGEVTIDHDEETHNYSGKLLRHGVA